MSQFTGAFDTTSILIDEALDRLENTYIRVFGTLNPDYPNIIRSAGTMAMEIIANSDALYHNVEHSIMVTIVGQEILRGKYLREGSVSAREWVHFIISLLCHDIGYVKGICPGDTQTTAIINDRGESVELPPGCTGAFLTPYHVERGKIFVRHRFKDHPVISAKVIARNIEHTRFPVPQAGDSHDEDNDYPGLVRSADLIGQLADPNYLQKLPALFHEFAETGANKSIGYESPDDVRENYPNFYWRFVSPHVGSAVEYLRVTREGRQWEAGLYSHIFSEEHRHLIRG
ncbi:MAG: metal-dependent phosphohydrolase [Gammaproteobacteria bacterium]|nr:metal-dependent phosphohydrolase [Gammaproteobacteria bacterium]